MSTFEMKEGSLLRPTSQAMPRDGATIFSDLIGKLDLLRVSPATNAGATVVTGCIASLRSVAVMPSSSIGSVN